MSILIMGGQLFRPLGPHDWRKGFVRDRHTGDDALIIRYSSAASGLAPNPNNQRQAQREDVYECKITKRSPKSHHQEGDIVMLTNPI